MTVVSILSETPRSLRKLKPSTSLGEVAKGTGISLSHVSRIFNGYRTPSLRVAISICTFLDVTLDALLAAINEATASVDPRRQQAA